MATKELKEKPIPTKDVKFQLSIRVYGEGYKTMESHAYLLDDQPMGVSAPVITMAVNIRILTLQQLRPILMYDQRNQMKRRSAVWQEVLFAFSRLPNIYNRPKLELNKYQFGFCRKNNLQDIVLVHPTYENRTIAELIGATAFFEHDLIIVPLTQISPEVENAPPPPLPEIPSPDRLDRRDRPGSSSSAIARSQSPAGSSGRAKSPGKDSATASSPQRESSPPREKRKVKKKKVIKDGAIVERDIE